MIEGHRRHLRAEQRRGDERGKSEPVPGQPRRQEHPQPEPGEEDDGAAQGEGTPDPVCAACQTARQECQGKDQPFSPPELQKQSCRRKPAAQTQQIPQDPPGCVPGGQPQQHRTALAEQIQRKHPPKLPQTPPAAAQKQTRQKGEQGHMKQIDQPVELV